MFYDAYSVAQLCLTFCMTCIACQAPLSIGFPRQEYCSGFPPPEGISREGSNASLLHRQVESLLL